MTSAPPANPAPPTGVRHGTACESTVACLLVIWKCLEGDSQVIDAVGRCHVLPASAQSSSCRVNTAVATTPPLRGEALGLDVLQLAWIQVTGAMGDAGGRK